MADLNLNILSLNTAVVHLDNTHYLVSYDKVIVKIQNGQVFLDENYWNYSNTTSKYRSQFLGEKTNETLKKIKSGIYKLVDLNKK